MNLFLANRIPHTDNRKSVLIDLAVTTVLNKKGRLMMDALILVDIQNDFLPGGGFSG